MIKYEVYNWKTHTACGTQYLMFGFGCTHTHNVQSRLSRSFVLLRKHVHGLYVETWAHMGVCVYSFWWQSKNVASKIVKIPITLRVYNVQHFSTRGQQKWDWVLVESFPPEFIYTRQEIYPCWAPAYSCLFILVRPSWIRILLVLSHISGY